MKPMLVAMNPLSAANNRGNDFVDSFAKWSVLALRAMAALAGTTSMLAADDQSVEQFRSFMSGLPPAGEIVFSVTFANRREEFYDYRWQSESFAVRKVDDMALLFKKEPDLEALVAGGRDGTKYWRLMHYQGMGPNLLEWDIEQDTSSPTNAVRLTVESLLFFPQAVLCMGLMHVKPGMARWDGDQFDTIEPEQHITGFISAAVDGRVRELNFTRTADKVRRYLVSYDYGNAKRPDWMPDAISMSLVEAEGKLRPLHRYRILSATFEQQPAENLRPTALIQGRSVVTGFLSNNDTYFSRGGQPRRLLRPEEVPAFNEANPTSRSPYLIFLAVAVLAAPAVLAIKAWLGRHQRTPSDDH